MSTIEYVEDFGGLDAFLEIIKEGVAGLIDGDHFFDLPSTAPLDHRLSRPVRTRQP